MKQIDVHWEVEDGYVGKSRPQHTKIDIDDFGGERTREAVEGLLYEYMDDIFNEAITYTIVNENECVDEICEALGISEEEE